MKCPKCGGEMIEGSLDKPTINLGDILFMGTDVKWKSSIGNKYIRTMGCKNCGYLESYAK